MVRWRKTIRIAILEDNPFYNNLLTRYVKNICNEEVYHDLEFEIKPFIEPHDFLEYLNEDLDILLLDYHLDTIEFDDKINGDTVFEEVQNVAPDCKVIMVSSQTNVHKAIELMKQGLYDYVDKNVNSRNRVGTLIQRILDDVA